MAGSDPRSPERDLARKHAGERGSRPAMERFLPRTVFVLVPSVVLSLEVLSLPLIGTGCRTPPGESRSAIPDVSLPNNVVVMGQEKGANTYTLVVSDARPECLQGLFLRLSCGPFPSRPSLRKFIAGKLVAVT